MCSTSHASCRPLAPRSPRRSSATTERTSRPAADSAAPQPAREALRVAGVVQVEVEVEEAAEVEAAPLGAVVVQSVPGICAGLWWVAAEREGVSNEASKPGTGLNSTRGYLLA